MICRICQNDLPETKFNPGAKTCRKCMVEKAKLRPEYHMKKALNNAKYRCENPNTDSYARYGAKGIKYQIDPDEFCEIFRDKWKAMMDAGQRPSIDRIDPSKDYVMDNIRIVEHKDNIREGNLNMQIAWLKKRKISKPCKDCQKVFPCTREHFHPKGKRKDGSPIFGPRCKACHRAYMNKRAKERGYWDRRDRTKRERR